MTPNQSLETIVISDSDLESSGSIEVIPDEPVVDLHACVESPKPVPKKESTSSPDSDVLVIESTDSDDYEEIETRLKRVDFGGPSEYADSTIYPPSKTAAGSSASRLGYSRSNKPKLRPTLSSSEENIKNAPLPEILRKKGSVLKQQSTPKDLSNPRAKKVKEDNSLETLKAKKIATSSKAETKARSEINKLVTDKKMTLKDFTVEVSHALEGQPFVPLFSSQLEAYNGKTNFFEPPPEVERLIRFRRSHAAQYDVMLKMWVPVDPYEELEGLYIIFFPADLLVLAISEATIGDMIGALRSSYNLPIRSQIFLMIDGLNAYYKRKGGTRPKKSDIEAAMTSLQAIEKCFIVHVDGPEDMAQWLFNITGDLGIRPHKRIRESLFAFCTDTPVKCGSTKADTYKKMLQQIRGITESAADGIVNEAPTLRELFEGYAQEHDADLRHNRLKDATISNRKDGAAKSRILNQALSKKVHDVVWGEDPLTLVI